MSDFVEALEADDLGRLRRIPKANPHVHSTLSASAERTSRALGVEIPRAPGSFAGLEPFFAFYAVHTKPHIQTAAPIEAVVRAGIDEAIDDGVTIMEMSLDLKHLPIFERDGVDFFDRIESIVGEYRGRIDFRPEIGISRPFDPSSDFVTRHLEAFLESGLFRSIDTYGAERTDLLPYLEPLFAKAARLGLKRKAHVGEFGPADSVLEAVRLLDLDEIQHGISSADSHAAVAELVARNIRLNICPTSNVVLGAARSYTAHPMRKLFDAGVRMTLGNDDPLIFDRTVSEEYLVLRREGVFSSAELDEIRREGLR